MFDEMNVNENTVAAENVSETVENTAAPSAEEGTQAASVHEAPKSKKATEKEANRTAGREKAKAKRAERREKFAARKAAPKEKLHLTPEEKAERRAAKAEAMHKETARAIARYIRMSPMKVNVVLDLIRGKNVNDAMAILQFTPKDAAVVVGKVLKSAVANAENNLEMDKDALYVSECHVGPGPIIKRMQPHAQGRAFSIHKRTSHITVVVAERA